MEPESVECSAIQACSRTGAKVDMSDRGLVQRAGRRAQHRADPLADARGSVGMCQQNATVKERVGFRSDLSRLFVQNGSIGKGMV